jgi:hypothetical protein
VADNSRVDCKHAARKAAFLMNADDIKRKFRNFPEAELRRRIAAARHS